MEGRDLDHERAADKAWAVVCQESGWVCRLCGEIPARGVQFEDGICDDCRKMTRNE